MLIEPKSIILNSGEKILIRSATKQDARLLCEHRYITSGETYFMARYPEEGKLHVDKMEENLSDLEESPQDFLVTAFLNDQIIGDAGITQIRNHMKYRHRAYFGISIRKQYCDLGLGSIILKIALEQAKINGFEQVELGVFNDNLRAIHLYEKYGFQKYGIQPKAFKLKDGTYRDEIIMVKMLT